MLTSGLHPGEPYLAEGIVLPPEGININTWWETMEASRDRTIGLVFPPGVPWEMSLTQISPSREELLAIMREGEERW